MLPKDFTAAEEEAFEEERSRRLSRRNSSLQDDILAFRRNSGTTPQAQSQFQTYPPPSQPRQGSISSSVVETPPSNKHTRQGSFGGGQGVQGSPTTLTFSLPTTASRSSLEKQQQRNPVTQTTLRGGVGGGALSPVMETGLSRDPTRTE